jgi:predicted transcriptional regulator
VKVKIVIDRPYGRIEIEGDSLDEIIDRLRSMPEWLDMIDTAIKPIEAAIPKTALKGLVEFTKEGPTLIVPREKLTIKESIILLLYASDPNLVEYRHLARLLSLSGRLSPGYPARLSELRSEGYIIKEGDSYRLTSRGRKFAEDIITKLKGGL